MKARFAISLAGLTTCALAAILTPGSLPVRLLLFVVSGFILVSPLWMKQGIARDPFHPNVAYRAVLLATVVFQIPGLLESRVVSAGTASRLLLTALSFALALEIAIRAMPPRPPAARMETGDASLARFFLPVWALGWIFRGYALRSGLLYGTLLATALGVTEYSNIFGQLNGLSLIGLLGMAVFSPSARPRASVYLMAIGELGWALVSGSKAAVVYAVLPLLLIYHWRGAPRLGGRFALSASLLAAALLALFPVIQSYRVAVHSRLAAGEDLSFGTVSGSLVDLLSGERRLPATDSSEASSEISARLNSAYSFGLLIERPDLLDRPASVQSYLPIALWWIPRALWPDKPFVSVGAWYGQEVLGWSYDSRSEGAITIWGDALLNLGWAGVFLVEFLWILAVLALYGLASRFHGWGLLLVASIYVRMLLGLEQNAAAPLVAMQQSALLVGGLRVAAAGFKWLHRTIRTAH